MVIGIPKEIMEGERRVSATPETVSRMVGDSLRVLVEKAAGEGSYYSDGDYAQAGAAILEDPAAVYEKADVILKVKEPLFNAKKNRHEVDMMRPGQLLITFIHPSSPVNHGMVRQLAEKGVTSLTLDGIPRISRAQTMDALTSMSTCAGYKGMLMAIDALPKFAPQIFSAVGVIKPINVLVVGAGVAGLQAIATAKRLGAVVHACDIRPDAAEQAKSLGAKLVELGIPPEVSIGGGGYARALPQEWLDHERKILAGVVKSMDIVFLSALIPGRQAPVLVMEETVKEMAPGSVIVDISIDQGGNCSVTNPGSVAVVHGVTINGIKNIPGLLPVSSTWMFANNIYNLLKYLVNDGVLQLDGNDAVIASALTTIGGKIVHRGALEAMNAGE